MCLTLGDIALPWVTLVLVSLHFELLSRFFTLLVVLLTSKVLVLNFHPVCTVPEAWWYRVSSYPSVNVSAAIPWGCFPGYCSWFPLLFLSGDSLHYGSLFPLTPTCCVLIRHWRFYMIRWKTTPGYISNVISSQHLITLSQPPTQNSFPCDPQLRLMLSVSHFCWLFWNLAQMYVTCGSPRIWAGLRNACLTWEPALCWAGLACFWGDLTL